ncbi:MAG: tetratricopeptide repeat protein, partial [Candidatus Omnitrophica bacterium]|nr:tetratricopeptide repeat protein [Candidatus Omnitrophota bacterium]
MNHCVNKEGDYAGAFVKQKIIHSLLLIGVVVICYVNIVHAPFLWDDESLIVQNTLIRDLKNIPALFSFHAWPTEFQDTFYRPLQMISYMFDYKFWKLHSFGYHITNILLHAGNAVLLYFLLSLLLQQPGAAFVGSIFFAIHPLHTEAISYIAGRADLLVSFFILIIFNIYTRVAYNDRKGRAWYTMFLHIVILLCLFSCAVWSKEIALSIPLIILLWHIFLIGNKKKWLLCWSVLGMGCITVGYLILRMHEASVQRFDIYAFSFLERLGVALKAFALYGVLVVAPFQLHMEHLVLPPEQFLSLPFIGSIFFTVLLVILFIYTLKRSKIASVGLLWYTILLFPVLNFIPLNATFSEHWIYLPSIGLSLGCSVVFVGARRMLSKKVLIVIVVLLAMLFSLRTVLRNRDWQDPVSFYTQILRYNPNNVKVLYNLGNIYLKNGRGDEAIKQYEKV